jgi:hypothetical protein
MIGAARLDVRTYEEIEADPTALGQAMLVVVLASIAAGLPLLFYPDAGLMAVLGGIVATLLGWFIWAALTFLIGTKILPEPQTRADMGQLLRTIGFASSPGILRIVGVIPCLGGILNFLIAIWMLVAMVVAVRQALDYRSTGRAIGVVVIGWLIYLAATLAIGAVFGLGRMLTR